MVLSKQQEEQIQMLEQQHAITLRQWLGTVDDAFRFRLSWQMHNQELEVAEIENEFVEQHGITIPPLTPYSVRELIVSSQVVSGGYLMHIATVTSTYEPVLVLNKQLDSWLSYTASSDAARIEVGQQMFHTLFSSKGIRRFDKLLRTTGDKKSRLRLRIVATDVKPLALPWEWLHDGQHNVLHSCQMAVMRHNLMETAHPIIYTPKAALRILATSSEEGATPATKILTQLAHDYPISIQLVEAQINSPGQLIQRLLKAERSKVPFHIWHHSGEVAVTQHGLSMVLNNREIKFTDIEVVLNNVQPVMLMVLHTSSAGPISRIQMLSAFCKFPIPMIVHLHNQTVALQETKPFFDTFYTSLTMRPVYEAFSRAIAILPFVLEENFAPYLLSRNVDTALFAG